MNISLPDAAQTAADCGLTPRDAFIALSRVYGPDRKAIPEAIKQVWPETADDPEFEPLFRNLDNQWIEEAALNEFTVGLPLLLATLYTDSTYGILNGFKTKNFLYESELYGSSNGDECTVAFSEDDPCVEVRGKTCINPANSRKAITKLQFVTRSGRIQPDWKDKSILPDELIFRLPFADEENLAGLAGFSASTNFDSLGTAGTYKNNPGYRVDYSPVATHMNWPPR